MTLQCGHRDPPLPLTPVFGHSLFGGRWRSVLTLGLLSVWAVTVASAQQPARDLSEPAILSAQPDPELSAADAALWAQLQRNSAPEAAPIRRAPRALFTCNGTGGPWSAAGSWSPSGPPTAADDVTISGGCTITVDTAAAALSLTVQSTGALTYDAATASSLAVGGDLIINNGGSVSGPATGTVVTHALSVGGNLLNNGSLDLSTNGNTAGVGLTFTNAGSHTFSGAGATTNLRTLTINKGTSSANVLELSTASFSVQGTSVDGAPMAFLTLTNGTFKVSGSFTLASRFFATAGYSIPATAGFWLNNANVTVAGQNASPTNNGTFRLSSGVYNVGTASGNSMGAGIGARFIIEGGTLNVAGRLNSTSTFITYTQSAGTVNVSTVGNAATSPSFGFTGGTGQVMNFSGGTINLVQASTNAAPVDYNQTGTMNFTGGTLNVGTAATTTNFLFRIQGQMPNVVLDNTGTNKNANLSGQGNFWGNLTIPTGSTLNLNPGTAQVLLMIGPTLTNNGAIVVNTNNTAQLVFASGLQTVGAPYASSYTGTGTVGTAALRLAAVGVQSPLGVSFAPTVTPLNIYRINALFGAITGADKLANGAGDATALVIQRGVNGNAYPASTFDVAPTSNIGSGGLTLVYAQSTTAVTTGPEIPASRTVLSFQVINPTGVTLAGGPLTATSGTNGLLLGAGALTTTGANLLTLSNTAAAAISGGSGTSFVSGPLARTLPASLASGATYTFPLGKSSFRMLELVNPTTNAGGTVVVQAEVFDTASGGTPGAGLSALGNRYWSAEITSGAANFTSTTVRLTEAGTPSVNAIAQSATLTGTYDSIGGTVAPPIIGPSSAVTSLGFLAVGTLSGAPTISGNFNVGTGGDFTTLTAAVTALNTRLMTGPVTFTLTDASYPAETYPIQINANNGASATNTLTIKPAAGVSPAFSGSVTSALILLNGADYVTIDGSNMAGGSTRNLSLTNTNAGTSSAVIWGQTVGANDPASNNTLKNLLISGNTDITTLVGIGFGGSTIGLTSLGTRNNNNRIENNRITTAQFGIFTQGASSAVKNTGTVITGNVLGGVSPASLSRVGIYAAFDDGVQITNNTVAGISGAFANADAIGIALGSFAVSNSAFTTNNDVANAVVAGNMIGPVVKTDTFSAIGISAATPLFGTTRITNNVVHSVRGNGTSGDFCAGIFVGNAGSANAPTEVYYNAVSITGVRDDAVGGAASQPAFALAILGANPLVDLRNNSLFNVSTAPTNGATSAGSYAIGLSSTAPLTKLTSDHNNLFSGGPASHFALFGSLTNVLADQTSLAAWQAATDKDANSIAADPLYISNTDLLPTVTSPLIYAGTPVVVTVDITGAARSPTVPTIGAYELGASLSITPTTLNFGNQAVGSTSSEQTVTLANTGNIPLNVTALTAAASPFARSGTGSCAATLPFSLAGGSSCTLTYTFAPTAIGTANQTLTVTADGPGSGTIALSGIGVQGNLVITPGTVNFGNQATGSTSAAQTVTLSNNGTASLSISALTTAAAPFARTDAGSCSGSFPITLAVSASCTLTFTFSPTVIGPAMQILTATSNGTGDTTITLQGQGVGVGSLSISPLTVNFGNQNVGTTSAPQTVTLGNVGTAVLTVNSLTTANAPFARVGTGTCSGSLPFTIAIGANCTLQYTFSPTAGGVATQNIAVGVDGTGVGPFSLNGTGVLVDDIFRNGFENP